MKLVGFIGTGKKKPKRKSGRSVARIEQELGCIFWFWFRKEYTDITWDFQGHGLAGHGDKRFSSFEMLKDRKVMETYGTILGSLGFSTKPKCRCKCQCDLRLLKRLFFFSALNLLSDVH